MSINLHKIVNLHLSSALADETANSKTAAIQYFILNSLRLLYLNG